MSTKTYESIPVETASMREPVSNVEKKPSVYITGALLIVSVFAAGFISGSSGINNKPPPVLSLTTSDRRFNRGAISSYARNAESDEMSAVELKSKWDDILNNAGMTELEAAQVTKRIYDAEQSIIVAGVNSFSNLSVESVLPRSINCSNPQVDLNFGIGSIYVCIGEYGGTFHLQISIKVAGLEVWGIKTAISGCGGDIPVPVINLLAASVDVTVGVNVCDRWITVTVTPCVGVWPFEICHNFGTGQISF